ncbi:hypothetical protein IZ6_17210 [Terrihabitans soli]|uniref:Uncharacterized protein n=1 Tax=Terrihabitans soli TaxID=708113 RepID=A0A6S6QNJ1_9HYPH|nr:hypothetical protein [Terrihabitans soli]BCJ90986.1 hypothetical protein IZ6_17210 [Terrihabitans soli]
MRGIRRSRRDIVITFVGMAVVVGLVAFGVSAVNHFPHLYEDFTAWKWRIVLAMTILPFTILGIGCVAFFVLGRLIGPRDRGPIS